MQQYSLSLSGPAAEFFRRLDRNDQQTVRRLFSLIQADPAIDNIHKIVFAVPPAVYTAYNDRQWLIIYHVVGNAIRVVSIIRQD